MQCGAPTIEIHTGQYAEAKTVAEREAELARITQAVAFAHQAGLIVNAISAKLLHHDHAHSDHSIRAAYLHVLADGLTSLAAIIALSLGMIYNIYWLDAVSGLIGSLVITRWAVKLILGAGTEIIEFRRK